MNGMDSSRKIASLPKQSSALYQLLLSRGTLNAKEIGEKMHIVPNSVYRAAKPLISLGMAEKLDSYPVTYKAVSPHSAANWYARALAQSFREAFSDKSNVALSPDAPSMTFIKDRQHMIDIVEKEILRSQHSFSYIVSGHRVPDSNVLAIRKVTTRGVKARCIVQNTTRTTQNPIETYADMGVEVRYLPNIGIRLFIFDSRTVIMTSYDITQSSRAFGIRFRYPPVAAAMNELFEEKWKTATPL